MTSMKYWIGIGLSVLLLAVFFHTADVRRMVEALAGADYWYLIPAVGANLVSVYFRTLRWTVMLRHLKPVRTFRLYPVVAIGYMANNLLPMRLGELVRSYYVGEREGINKASALVTVLTERVLDALTLLLFVAGLAPFVSVSGLLQSFEERFSIPWQLPVVCFILLFVSTFVALVLVAVYPEKTREAALWLTRHLPPRFRSLLDSLLGMLFEGLSPLRSPQKLALMFGLSIPIWLTEAAVFYIVGFSFGVDSAHAGAGQMAITMVLVTAITNLGSSVPLAPGGIGLFETIARETLVLGPLASVDRSVAAGFALVVHAVLLLPMIVLGQVFLWANHLSLRRLSQQVQTGRQCKDDATIGRAPKAPSAEGSCRASSETSPIKKPRS